MKQETEEWRAAEKSSMKNDGDAGVKAHYYAWHTDDNQHAGHKYL